MSTVKGRSMKQAIYGVLLCATIVAWVFLAPTQLGGPVSYVMTHGISMEPVHHEGDLVVVREAPEYEVGDIVAYRSSELDAIILHRIIGREGDAYVFKGDNNDWIDSERPTRADLIGEEWLTIAGGGKFLTQLREPRKAAFLAGLIAVFSFGLFGEKGRKRRVTLARAPKRLGSLIFPRGASSTAMAVCGGLAVAFALLGMAALLRPDMRTVPAEIAYRSEGSFSYSADAPVGPVYSEAKVLTGQPLFLKVVDNVRFRFDYTFATEAEHDVTGTIGLQAILSDDFGWTRSFELASPKPFKKSAAHIAGDFDLREVGQLIDDLATSTGLPRASYDLKLVPTVTLTGTVDGRPLNELFAPPLAFDLDPYSLRLPPAAAPDPTVIAAGSPDRLRPVQEGVVETTRSEPNTMKLLRFDLPVVDLRNIAALGLLICIGLLMASMAAQIRAEDFDNEVDLIGARFKELLVPVRSFKRDEAHATVEVTEVDALVRLAEQHERMILHRNDGDGMHSYFVEGDRCVYQYRARNGKSVLSADSTLVAFEPDDPVPSSTKK
jgi:signal peptidase I